VNVVRLEQRIGYALGVQLPINDVNGKCSTYHSFPLYALLVHTTQGQFDSTRVTYRVRPSWGYWVLNVVVWQLL